jgi:hypothetical protein
VTDQNSARCDGNHLGICLDEIHDVDFLILSPASITRLWLPLYAEKGLDPARFESSSGNRSGGEEDEPLCLRHYNDMEISDIANDHVGAIAQFADRGLLMVIVASEDPEAELESAIQYDDDDEEVARRALERVIAVVRLSPRKASLLARQLTRLLERYLPPDSKEAALTAKLARRLGDSFPHEAIDVDNPGAFRAL